MKANKVRKTGPWALLAGLGLVAVVATVIGIIVSYEKLHAIWVEQCVITDMERQVSIDSGKMVKADVIAGVFGLKPGANLALIDFAEKREAVLAKIPNLREIRIRRHLPNRVAITFEEREPIARLGVRGQKGASGKVVDKDGVVFYCARGTQLLPTIREANAPGTAAGTRLGDRARAALRLVEACHESDFAELGLLDVDVAAPDWLQATINAGSSYAQLKIAWEGMDDPATPVSRASLLRQLTHLRDAIRTRVGDGTVIWNATDFSSPGRIYADTKGKL